MKLLPHYFKRIGLGLFLLGFIVSAIDNGRQGFMDGRSEASDKPIEYEITRILPDVVSDIADYVLYFGLLLYIVSKNKREDEFVQKMRYESAFIVFLVTLVVVFLIHIFKRDYTISPSALLELQLVLYLILRWVRRGVILGGGDEEQS